MALRLLPQPAPHRRRAATTSAISRAIVDWLGTRRGLLDAVVFSGGEPTAQAELAGAIAAVRALGFAVGLHTGGAYPRRLADVLPQVDWVGIDVKAPRDEYAVVTGVADSGVAALASLDLVLASGVAHEVRTTVHPALTPPAALERLARELAERGVTRWVLQPFRATGCANEALVSCAPHGATIDAGAACAAAHARAGRRGAWLTFGVRAIALVVID